MALGVFVNHRKAERANGLWLKGSIQMSDVALLSVFWNNFFDDFNFENGVYG